MRTIAVKGTGKVNTPPDTVEISLNIRSKDKEYSKSVEKSNKKIDSLKSKLMEIRFDEDALKTVNYNVYTEYDNIQNDKGVYQRVFSGYVCQHMMLLRLDFSSERLNETLIAIAESGADAELNISFTVRDRDALSRKVLESAVKNSKEKAKIICKAAGMKLGAIQNINYHVSDINTVSVSRYEVESALMSSKRAVNADMAMGASFSPEDIESRDEVTVLWEIE